MPDKELTLIEYLKRSAQEEIRELVPHHEDVFNEVCGEGASISLTPIEWCLICGILRTTAETKIVTDGDAPTVVGLADAIDRQLAVALKYKYKLRGLIPNG